MFSLYFLALLSIIFLSIWIIEFRNHQKRVYSIPIRIHVNGTRGKSSVTRLIGAGLRADGKNAITKVTGTFPRLILEDGTETYIHRKSSANIIEQLDIVKFAEERKCDALIIECMALQPKYQWVTESQIIHATIGVMTNVRIDHTDVMGETIGEIAESLGNTIPKNFSVFTSEDENAHVLKSVAQKKNSTLTISATNNVSFEEMKGFSYIEHRENVALALDVCMSVGIKRSIALQGMYDAIPDEGALTKSEITELNKTIKFYNAFAANDPDSTLMIWKKIRNEIGMKGKKSILLNTRQDRLERSEQLVEMIGKHLHSDIDHLVLIGESTHIIEQSAIHSGCPKQVIINMGWIDDPSQVYESALSLTDSDISIVAIGNMGGKGAEIANYFENRSLNVA